MNLISFIQKRIPFFLLLLLLPVLVIVIRTAPGAGNWSTSTAFRIMPYLVFVLCAILGACFHQGRVAFISFFSIAVMMLASVHGFSRPDDGKFYSMLFLVSVYLPLLSAVFFLISEQSILSPQGYIKVSIIISALVVIMLIPKIDSLVEVLSGPDRPFLMRPASRWLDISWLGLILLAAVMPVFFVHRPHEGHVTGPFLFLYVVLALLGLNVRSSLWPISADRAAFVLLNTAAGASLLCLVLESAWRHANIDELTQVPGRRALKVRMERLHRGFGLAVIDIDHFKKINDRYGHDTGDQVLRYVASQLKKFSNGQVYRFGGEEFVIVSSTKELKAFETELDEMRAAIEQRPFGIRGVDRPVKVSRKQKVAGNSEKIRITVSAGCAVQGGRLDLPEDVLNAADKALYRAKKGGRNQVKASR